ELALELGADRVDVDADPTRLVQVLGNLLENAVKFSDAGGHVAVKLRAGGGRALLSVADDGAGMGAPTLARVFEPFMQAHSPLARTQGGLGLGLALIRNLVELHGGSVAVSSAGIGKGTEFVVSLPLAG